MKKLWSLIAILLLTGCGEEQLKVKEEEQVKPPEPVIEETTISLAMVGDVLIHSALYADAKTTTGYDFNNMVIETKELISQHDLAFYNQETILGGSELGLSSYPRFNSPYEVGDAFVDLGFNLVALANNHSYDRGETAIINSLNYWDSKEGIITAGTYRSESERVEEKIGEEQGITYALLSYTTLNNGLATPQGKEYLVNMYNYDIVKQDVERLSDKVDVLMVSMHWGVEYVHTPNEEQIKIANELAALGVDIVIGHHPHVIQPITYIDDTLVIYSLGNYLSGQVGESKTIGALVSLDITKKTVDKKVESITYSNLGTELIFTDSYTYYSENYSSWIGSNYKLYPFSKLNDSILPNYLSLKDKYDNILTNMYQGINVNKYTN